MVDENRGMAGQSKLTGSRMPAKAAVQKVLQEAGIGIALLVLIAIFSATAPHFMDESNVTNILTQITINLVMATGMTFVILIGG
ncbi:MAG: ABC transporter permease, partial [Verrucomicrobia bacterium]|nr:ABC transporter permease [Verrucomicrobiota bacterium]